MVIEVEWSKTSQKQLKQIFNYYSREANRRIADKIISKITEQVSILYKTPFAGQKEPLLIEYNEEYRYLVVGNYIIVYWYHQNIVTISAVFDTRQNPIKIASFK